MRKSFIILFVFILFVQGCNLFVGIGGEDSKPPYIEIISPKNGEVFEGDIVFIRGIAFDNEKLSKVLIKIGNKEWVEIGNQENWSYEWDISGIDSGAYSITVKALDFVGNESSVSITVIIDKTLPLISIISPTNNSYVKGTISIDFTATDDYQINGIYLSTNGGSDFDITIFEGGVKNFSSSFSLDTTRLTEGDNILVFKVIDNTGKSKNYSLVLKVDNRIPQITLSSHQQIGGYLVFPEDTTIYGTIDDVYPPKEVMIVMNTNTNYANLTGYSWKYDIYFSLSSPSTNEIEVICVDQLDVTNSTNLSVIIDKMPPMSFITFPSAGSITNATIITIQGYSVDDVGVSKIFLSLNGGTNFSQIEYTNHLGTNYFWTNVNLNLLPEGDVVLVVKSYDFASKSLNSQGVLFTLDKTPPVVYITSPTNNTTLSTQFLITAYSEDNNNPVRSMIIKIDDIPVITNNGSYISYLYMTNLQGEGKRNIEVISIDRAGNYSSSIISVVVNTDPPKVSNFVVNSEGSGVFVRGIVYVSGTAYDTTQVSNVGYAIGSLSNIVWIVENAGTSTTNFSFSFDSRDITDGMIDLYIRPIDNLGGFVDFITNLYVDNTPPSITFVNPSYDYGYFGGMINIVVSVNDNISLRSFRIFTNDGVFSNGILLEKVSEMVVFTWDLLNLSNGQTNSVIIELVDMAMNTNYATNYFIVSNDVPELIVTSPALNSYVTTNLIVSGIAIYTNGGIQNVKWKVGDNMFQDVEINVFSSDSNTNFFTNFTQTSNVYVEGINILTVRAIANNGNYIDSSVLFYLDYTLPTGNIITPTNGDYYGVITISGNASDTNSLTYNSGIKRVRLFIETNNVRITGWDGVVLVDNTNAMGLTWSTNWDTTTLPVATNVNIIVEISDNAGNVRYLTNIINVRPYISSLSTYNTWINNTLTINGRNFGTGNVQVVFKGVTNTVVGNNTTLSLTIPSSARSGYVKVIVNGIESINSNWIDLWDIVNVGSVLNAQINSRFTIGPNDKIFFVQGGRSGNTWATNFLRTDYLGSFQTIPFFGSSSPNGETVGQGNAIYVYSNVIVVAYSPKNVNGIWVSVFTNTPTSIVRVTNVKIDTITLGGIPLMDVFIDTSLGIHVVWSDRLNSRIRYAYSPNYGESWVVEDCATNVGFSPVILDAHPSIYFNNGIPYIAYYDHSYAKLMLAYKVGTVWVNEIVDPLFSNGLYSDIFVDSAGRVHISYYNSDQGDLIYSTKGEMGWQREVVDYSGITGSFTGIDINGGEKAISYYNETTYSGYLAYYNGINWKIIQIPQYTGMNAVYGKYSQPKFASNGDVWVGFVDNANVLWVAKYLK